jgi:putative FmdB family regulatory protein
VPGIPQEDDVPTYQYACTACGHQLEAVQSFSDPALTECPECAGRLRKLFSSVGIVFKGSGFYRNDSRSDGSPKKDAPADSKPKTETTTSSTPAPSTTSSATPASPASAAAAA